jgi:hypothetical protein
MYYYAAAESSLRLPLAYLLTLMVLSPWVALRGGLSAGSLHEQKNQARQNRKNTWH